MTRTRLDPTKLLVKKAALRVLPLEGLQTDPSYQREVKSGHKKIISDFDENALGIPLVGEREDGSLWIVDGLQRVTALRKMNWREVRAEVFASQGPEHEAAVFKLVNMNRTKLSAFEQFRALLTAQDEAAWRIKEAVEAEGFSIRLKRSSGRTSEDMKSLQLTCINTLMEVDRTLGQGVDAIRFSLRLVKECWPGDGNAINNRMISGMGIFFQRNDGVIDMERLVPRAKTVTVQKILYAANQGCITGGGMAVSNAVADQLEKVYRKRLLRK